MLSVSPLCAAAGGLRLKPDEAVARALSVNKALRAAQLEVKRAKVQLFWEGRLDNPELELEAAGDTLGRAEGEAAFAIAFVQQFPLTSRLRDAKALRRVQVALAQAEVDERRRTLANEVRKLCVEVAASQRRAAVYRQLKELNSGIAEFLESAAGRGEASPLDLAGTRLAGKALEREVRTAEVERTKWLAQLRPQLGLGAGAALQVEADLALPNSAPAPILPLKAALARRPDYQAALIRGDVARAELALAKARSLEDLAFKLFAERERATDDPGGLEGNTFVGVGISIPLPLRTKNEAEIESAEIGIAQSRLAAEALGVGIENEIAGALAERASDYAIASEASGEILELADDNLREFRDAHATGRATFLQVQRAQEQKLELENAALDLAREYHLADVAVKYATAIDVAISAKRAKTKSSKQ